MTTPLARLALAASLVTAGACSDRTPAPQVVTLQQAPAPVTSDPKIGQMAVTGSATLEVVPDCADLTMTIVSDGARPGQAAASVKAKQTALLAALAKLGLESTDLKLSHQRLDPIYASTPDGWSQLKVATYRAEITITATTKNFDLLGSMLEAGANAGATSMSTQFRRSDIAELKKQVRDMALKAAKDKAQQTASALGIQLGPVITVNEIPAGYMWSSAYFPRTANAMDVAPSAGGAALGGALGGVSQTLNLDVSISYELPRRA